jgi:hypothetical protein
MDAKINFIKVFEKVVFKWNLLESCLACTFLILLAKSDICEGNGAPIKAITGYKPTTNQNPTPVSIKKFIFVTLFIGG